MTTLKKTITLELLDSTHDSAELQEVFQRHKNSKGPFYLALADATAQLQQQFGQVCEDVSQAETRIDDLRTQFDALEVKAERAQEVIDRAGHAEDQLAGAKELLERVDWLSQRGFGLEELDRLYEIMGKIAADHGLPPEEGMAQFFQTLQRFEQVVSMELETRNQSWPGLPLNNRWLRPKVEKRIAMHGSRPSISLRGYWTRESEREISLNGLGFLGRLSCLSRL